jgi:hypothetical protein
MISRLLRYILHLWDRILKVSWSTKRASLFIRLVQRWSCISRLLKPSFILNWCSGPTGRTHDAKRDHETPWKDSRSGPIQSNFANGSMAGTVSFSLLPRPGNSGSSIDAQCIRSDDISIILQPPQSPTFAHSAEGRVQLGAPGNSPVDSAQGLDPVNHVQRSEDHLEAPRRFDAMTTSPSARPRSLSPGDSSSRSLRPTSSYGSFRPYVPSKLGPGPPRTPSRTSLHSHLSVRPSRPPSVVTPEPPPRQIIEPPKLREYFEDAEGRMWPSHPDAIYRYDRRIYAWVI